MVTCRTMSYIEIRLNLTTGPLDTGTQSRVNMI